MFDRSVLKNIVYMLSDTGYIEKLYGFQEDISNCGNP